jgi:FkbM family methyltransferase
MIIGKQEKESLLRQLAQKSGSLKKTRLKRLLSHPIKMVYPKLLSSTESTRRLYANTFWGGEMEIILPDLVSTQIWRNGFFEEDVCTFILKNLEVGMTFLDIGAHYGFFSLLASYLIGPSGKVFSFEPTPSTFDVLESNTKNNNNIKLFNLAAYDQNCEIEFLDFEPGLVAFNSAFGIRDERGKQRSQINKPSQHIKVKASTVDSIFKNENISIDFIKIDAESSEMSVLKG